MRAGPRTGTASIPRSSLALLLPPIPNHLPIPDLSWRLPGLERSRGQSLERLGLARAIALDPELIMYDEPFAGLDPISMGVAANLIRRLNDATGATSLIVSHDVQECFLISDYAYLISSGRIVGHGTPAELKASDDPEVRQFIRGEPDGPVPFHYPAPPIAEGFGISR